jgi:DNA topoisomerase-1
MPRLRRVDCSGPGIRRLRRGRGFSYVDERGNRVDRGETLERIRALVIPPAWEDVWICPLPNGHIQAVGTDARGRRQYRYHDDWRRRRDREKFEQMLDFGRALPSLRRRVARQVRGTEPGRDRVLAGAVRLLDRGFFRIGGETYAEENDSYGLATMLRRHVRLERNVLVFDYPAKSGKRRLQSVVDADVHRLVGELKARRGGSDELLAYKNGRRWHDVRSADINEHVKELTAGDFTAKDFRTWNATVLAAVEVAKAGPDSHSRTAPNAWPLRQWMRSPPTWATRRPCAGPPTSIRACSTPSTPARRSPARSPRTESPIWTTRPSQARVERAVLDLLSAEDDSTA